MHHFQMTAGSKVHMYIYPSNVAYLLCDFLHTLWLYLVTFYLQGDTEYYREQYRKLKGENDTLRNKVEDLSEEVESAQVRRLSVTISN